MEHIVSAVTPGSIAEEMEIEPGDVLVSVNGQEPEDVFDYRYLMNEEEVLVVIRKPDGEEWELEIEKEYEDDLGMEFENGLMDDYRSCRNKCMFCFIDQLPKGMRDTLYFKDDDSRLSFLQGNYVTLTNLKDKDVERIIRFKLAPINISVQTTNPELRVKMMNNKHAGEALGYLKQLADAGIAMNCQLVLCPGLNDGAELVRSMKDLSALYPAVQSVACVPVGLTKYRSGLYELRPFTTDEAKAVVDQINQFGDLFEKQHGTRLFYPADEFFLKAKEPLPEYSYFGEYNQLENGVGMMTLLQHEFFSALEGLEESDQSVSVSIATGVAAYTFICGLVDELQKKWHNLVCRVYTIKNEFFGENITVSGLVTGSDLIAQLKGKELGDRLLFPSAMLRKEQDMFLDDVTPQTVELELGLPVYHLPNDGYELLHAIIGRE